MTDEEVLEIVRSHLPKLMKENAEVRQWVRELVAEYGVTREEWNALLARIDRLTEAIEHNTEQIHLLWQEVRRLWQAIDELREEFRQLREEFRQLREEFRQLREEFRQLREEFHQTRVAHESAIVRLERAVQQLDRRLGAIGARWGIMTETAFREALWGILEQSFGVQVTRWRHYDAEGAVWGHPSWVEADVLIRDERHLLVEIKSSMSRGDMAEFYRIGQVYQRATNAVTQLIVISPFVDERAMELAQTLNIAVHTHPEEVESQ